MWDTNESANCAMPQQPHFPSYFLLWRKYLILCNATTNFLTGRDTCDHLL